jgi:hypothetical protein
MSGYTARMLDFSAGPDDLVIHKPISREDLGRSVRAALDGANPPA